ncbi:Retrovirus-related Pol polyprotein from transposon 297 [Biomphalaria pfeifferi]|uniref:Retrovirus-related Pol polyprotein from transposon 297 n=1 Tax=Biomphalaria pfeifferi TaxID=112525 RepID=A0AAD8F485_BIOPF|nr:Retrovirus-related Pol polyprotein from transposon 297 [Biomphalaria pfeifferi]
MPFGLVTAPAKFSRCMRRLLHGLEEVINYLDDILIFSSNWEAHLETLGKVLSRLERANLTARQTKSMLGFRSLEFMGYELGNGSLKPETGKVSKILNIEVPRTKTQVRAIMGLINYYRRFVPNFAAITAPLSDLTKKGKLNQIVWTDTCQRALESVQAILSSDPILRLPDS